MWYVGTRPAHSAAREIVLLELKPPGTGDRRADRLRNLERFAREHRRLIRDADALEVSLRIEARRDCACKRGHEIGRREPPFDEVADETRLFHVANDEIVAVRVLADLRGGGARLLVIVLPVNE